MPTAIFEPIHSVHDWYDGPRSGVADFRGERLLYISHWDSEADDWSEVYELKRVEVSHLALLDEAFRIWERWRAEFDAGKVELESGPSLPQDRSRAEALRESIGPLENLPGEVVARAKGEFRGRFPNTGRVEKYNLEVRWYDVADASQ